MALDTGGWFPHGPGHDVEAGHEDDVPRGLKADDALRFSFVCNRAPRLFLGDLRRRGGEGVVQLSFQISSPFTTFTQVNQRSAATVKNATCDKFAPPRRRARGKVRLKSIEASGM